MTKQTCKRLLGTLFFLGILALTFWYVFRDENLGKVLDYLTDADIRYVLPAMAAVVGFILGESPAMSQLLHPLGAKPKFYRCCLISFVGFFYSAITPSASGGQPMQLLYMRRDGVPGAVSTVVLAGMIVCRGISYYTQLLISGVMTGAAHLVFQKNLEKKGGNLPSLLP